MKDRIKNLLNPVLIDGLPQSLKDAIDDLLAKGGSRQHVLAIAKRIAKTAPLTYAAVAAYLESK